MCGLFQHDKSLKSVIKTCTSTARIWSVHSLIVWKHHIPFKVHRLFTQESSSNQLFEIVKHRHKNWMKNIFITFRLQHWQIQVTKMYLVNAFHFNFTLIPQELQGITCVNSLDPQDGKLFLSFFLSDQLSITCIQWTNASKFTPSPPWQIYYKSFTEGVFISSGLANWALPHERCTPPVVDWTTM